MKEVKKSYNSPVVVSMPVNTSTLSGGFNNDDGEAGYAS